MDIRNNFVVVTGGSSGIGLALARKFLHNGNRVLICGRNFDKLKRVKKENPDLEIVHCDMAILDDIKKLVDTIKTKFSEVNILVNNAGIQFNYRFDDGASHIRRIDEEININLTAQLRLTDLLLPILLKKKSAIVNVSSALAFVPKESAPIYCATKAGIHAFSKTLRYQLEKSTVKVFEIVPSLVETDMTKGRSSSKISPEAVAVESLRGIERDRYLIKIGKTKILFFISRLFPALADKIIRGG